MNDRSVAGSHRRTGALFRGFVRHARRFALRAGIVTLLLAASFGIAPAAMAADCNPDSPYPPTPCTAVVTPSEVEEGGTVTVSGAGFDPGSRVSIDILSHMHHLGTTTADSHGDVSAQVTLPDEIEDGGHVIQLKGRNPDGTKRVLEGTVTVVEDDSHRHGGSSGSLANTGSPDLTGVGVLSFALVGTGAGVLWARKRRRRPHED